MKTKKLDFEFMRIISFASDTVYGIFIDSMIMIEA